VFGNLKKIVKPPFTPSPDNLAERLRALNGQAADRAKRIKDRESMMSANASSNTSPAAPTLPKKDSYDELDDSQEDEWYSELSKHGINATYESITSPGNREKIWGIYSEWSRKREQERERE
jgi:hypothetical protein